MAAGDLGDAGSDLGICTGSDPLDENGMCPGGPVLTWHHCPEVHKAIDGVRFIADHTKREEDSTRVIFFSPLYPSYIGKKVKVIIF